MNKAALNVYQAIRRDGTQKNVVDTMQTRMELYDFLDYHSYEQKLDELFAEKKVFCRKRWTRAQTEKQKAHSITHQRAP